MLGHSLACLAFYETYLFSSSCGWSHCRFRIAPSVGIIAADVPTQHDRPQHDRHLTWLAFLFLFFSSVDEPHARAAMRIAVIYPPESPAIRVEVHLRDEEPSSRIDRLDVRDMSPTSRALDARREHDRRARARNLPNRIAAFRRADRPPPGVTHPAQISLWQAVIFASALLRPIGALPERPPVIPIWTRRGEGRMARDRHERVRWWPGSERRGRDLWRWGRRRGRNWRCHTHVRTRRSSAGGGLLSWRGSSPTFHQTATRRPRAYLAHPRIGA